MGKVVDAVKKISNLPGSKLFLPLLLVGLILLVCGRYVKNISLPKEKQTAATTSYTEQEERLAGILTGIDGAGEVEVMITTKDKTSSVVVLSTGAGDPIVGIKLRQAVRTAMQTDDKNIKIIKKQS